MSQSPIRNVLHYLHRIVDRQHAAESADRQLLARFVAQRDEFAFEALVRRHGPMVLAVCRRLLSDPDDAEDAFQATFLVLVKRAAAISRPDQLAGWLHGVATRVAGKARQQRQRRATATLEHEPPAEEVAMDDVMRRELQTALDEEVALLPEHYQLPFVLCHLSGRSNEEAAAELGCAIGTIYSRLARAREMLRERLARRGLVWSAATLAVALTPYGAPAAVPPALVQHTVSAGLLLAAGQSLAGSAVSGQTLTLMEATLQTMYVSKLKMTAALVVGLAVAGTGIGFASYHMLGRAEAAAPVAAADKDKGPDKPEPDSNDKLKLELMQLQGRIKAAQERQDLENQIKKLKVQLDQLEGKPLVDGKIPGVTFQGKAVDHWLALLRDCEPSTRLQGLRAMAAIGDELGDDAPRVAAAITAILKAEGVVPLVSEALAPLAMDDKKPGTPVWQVQPEVVQLQALYALASIGTSAKVAIPKLVTIQLDVDDNTHGTFQEALQRFRAMQPHNPGGIPPADPYDSTLVETVIQRIDPEGKVALPLLAAAIQKGKPRINVASNALKGIIRYKEKSAPWAAAVVNGLRVENGQVQFDVMQALREMGDEGKPAAIKALIALAKDKEKDKAAAEAAAGVLHNLYPAEAKESGIPFTEPPQGAPAPM